MDDKAKTKYKNDWARDNLERIALNVPKGKKEEIKAAALAEHKSINQFINDAIDAAMKK